MTIGKLGIYSTERITKIINGSWYVTNAYLTLSNFYIPFNIYREEKIKETLENVKKWL